MVITVIDNSNLKYQVNNSSPAFIPTRASIVNLVIAFIALLLLSVPLYAQGFKWPENPKNIQVLSKELTGARLGFPMRGFTRALGVRCSYCHVGEESKPLSTYDFASDANPNKDRAREMLRMLKSINGHLGKIQPSGNKRVNMWCHTCHRGLAQPISLSDQIEDTYKEEGVDASLAQYSELKEKYYGTGYYQFVESVLNDLGYNLLRQEDPHSAIKFFELNTKEYPKSGNAWDSLAESYMKAGNSKKAIKYYRKSLKLNPKNRNAVNMLKKLEEG